MIVGVPKETLTDENRVALIPAQVSELAKAKIEVQIETGAGLTAGFPDDDYKEKGAKIVSNRADIYKSADIILQVMGPGANPQKSEPDFQLMKEGQVIIGFQEALSAKESIDKLAKQKIICFAMELVPRITRAQSMDALSSMANIAGYKSVIIAAQTLPKIFPMMMTAAGTIVAARVFVVGVGVAGLQAIATAKRLGAIVYAYDVRPAVKEQVESLGGKFVEMELDTGDSEDKGGYAKALDEEFYKKQRELMTKVISECDVVITTAAIPGKKAPILVTEAMVKEMKPRSIIVDLAAERGGNCECTEAGKSIEKHGVTILGPVNVSSSVPFHSSQMYSKNITTFLLSMVKEGKIQFNMDDEVVRETMITKNGEVINSRVKEALGL